MTDVWFAALAIESGCEWITSDRDFARFPSWPQVEQARLRRYSVGKACARLDGL